MLNIIHKKSFFKKRTKKNQKEPKRTKKEPKKNHFQKSI